MRTSSPGIKDKGTLFTKVKDMFKFGQCFEIKDTCVWCHVDVTWLPYSGHLVSVTLAVMVATPLLCTDTCGGGSRISLHFSVLTYDDQNKYQMCQPGVFIAQLLLLHL